MLSKIKIILLLFVALSFGFEQEISDSILTESINVRDHIAVDTFFQVGDSVVKISGVIDLQKLNSTTAPTTGYTRIYNVLDHGVSLIMIMDENGFFKQIADGSFICHNSTASLIPKGTPCYRTGTIGNTFRVAPAIANDSLKAIVVGITMRDISAGAFGRLQRDGTLYDQDISSFDSGSVVFLSPTTAGGLTNIKPSFPNYVTYLGHILSNKGAGNSSMALDINYPIRDYSDTCRAAYKAELWGTHPVPVEGTNNQVLTTDGAGNWSFSDKTGSTSGTITSINGSSVALQTIVGENRITVVDSGTGNYVHKVRPVSGYVIPPGDNDSIGIRLVYFSELPSGGTGDSCLYLKDGVPTIIPAASYRTMIGAASPQQIQDTTFKYLDGTTGQIAVFNGPHSITSTPTIGIDSARAAWKADTVTNPPAFCNDIYDPTGHKKNTHDNYLEFRQTDRYIKAIGSQDIYFKGRLYTKTNDSIQIPATGGIWYVYYDSLMTIQRSQTMPSFYLPWIAGVYWNSTQNFGLCGDERHGASMNWRTHQWIHDHIGAQYYTGLALTAGNTSFSLSSGGIQDEDIIHDHGAQTVCNLAYYNGSSNFTYDTNNTSLYKGVAGALYYNNGTTLTPVSNNYYVASFVIMTNEINGKPLVILGQRQDVTLAAAIENNVFNTLTLSQMQTNEFVHIYTVFYRNDATPFEQVVDYRNARSLTSGYGGVSDHAMLTHLEYSVSGHTGFSSGTNNKADSSTIADSSKKAPVTGSNGYFTVKNGSTLKTVSSVDSNEFKYIDGATSNLQTQINSKEPSITSGLVSQYWNGLKQWVTLNVAAIAGLTDSLAAKLPLHGKSDSAGIADSSIHPRIGSISSGYIPVKSGDTLKNSITYQSGTTTITVGNIRTDSSLLFNNGRSEPLSNSTIAGIYRSIGTGAANPFLEYGNLILQPRSSIDRGIYFIVGLNPALVGGWDRLGNFVINGYTGDSILTVNGSGHITSYLRVDKNISINNTTDNANLLTLNGADKNKWIDFNGHGLKIGTSGYANSEVYFGPKGSTSGSLISTIYLTWADATPTLFNRWAINGSSSAGNIYGYANDGTTQNIKISVLDSSFFNGKSVTVSKRFYTDTILQTNENDLLQIGRGTVGSRGGIIINQGSGADMWIGSNDYNDEIHWQNNFSWTWSTGGAKIGAVPGGFAMWSTSSGAVGMGDAGTGSHGIWCYPSTAGTGYKNIVRVEDTLSAPLVRDLGVHDEIPCTLYNNLGNVLATSTATRCIIGVRVSVMIPNLLSSNSAPYPLVLRFKNGDLPQCSKSGLSWPATMQKGGAIHGGGVLARASDTDPAFYLFDRDGGYITASSDGAGIYCQEFNYTKQ